MSSTQDQQEEAQFLGNDCAIAPAAILGGDIHSALAQTARAVYAEAKPRARTVAEAFAAQARAYIPGVSDVVVHLGVHDRSVRPGSAGEDEPHPIDQITAETGEGPCEEAASTQRIVRVPDLGADGRWPAFSRAVLSQTPVRSMLSFQLYSPNQKWGSLTLCGQDPHALGAGAEAQGAIVATHAALALEYVQQCRQYRSGLGSRDIIGQAKGLLMERYDIPSAAAFSLLTRLALSAKKQVIVVAKELVEAKSRQMQ